MWSSVPWTYQDNTDIRKAEKFSSLIQDWELKTIKFAKGQVWQDCSQSPQICFVILDRTYSGKMVDESVFQGFQEI